MYSSISTLKDPLTNIFEIMYGLDSVMVEVEGILMGFYKRSKTFLNIKNKRWIKDIKSSYEVNNEKGNKIENALLFYIGL